MSTTTSVLYGADAVELVSKFVPGEWKENDVSIVILLRDNVLHGACILNKFDEYSVELTFYFVNSPIMVREFVEEIFTEIFITQNKLVALMYTSSSNSKMLRLHQRLNHTFSGIVPQRFGENAGYLFTITKDEAIDKWLKRFK